MSICELSNFKKITILYLLEGSPKAALCRGNPPPQKQTNVMLAKYKKIDPEAHAISKWAKEPKSKIINIMANYWGWGMQLWIALHSDHFLVWPPFSVLKKKFPKDTNEIWQLDHFRSQFFPVRFNRLNSFTRMLSFYCFSSRHRLHGQNLAI